MPDSKCLDDGLAYVQQPTLHGDRIVFCAEGNLWETTVDGGDARRLTSSSAPHSFPRFSPDGRQIAFSSGDEGPGAVWVMPSNGGPARRLTFHTTPDQVVGWTPDGANVVFRTLAVEGIRAQTLASVPACGGPVTGMPLGRATTIAYHADGERIAVNRHACDPAWWKRYKGGRAGRIWIGSRTDGEFDLMPGGPRTDACPMWIGDQLWFLSDQDGMGDLWVADADGGNRRRVTAQEEFFVRWPQADGTRIVYAAGGRLFLLETTDADPVPREVPVTVRGHSLATQRKFVDVPKSIQSMALSAAGDVSLFTMRGRVVRLPNWHGAARVVAAPHGVRFRKARFLGDDGRMVAVAQIDGEDRVVVLPADGIGSDLAKATVLGSVGRRIQNIEPSPDGRRIAIADQGRGLHIATLSEDGLSAEFALVDDLGNKWIRDVAWSPCSTWLAYSRSSDWWSSRVFVWSADDGSIHGVSRDEFVDFSPAWDPAGRFLALLSSRHLDPYGNALEHDFAFVAPTRAYALMLRAGEEPPFAADVVPPEKAPERVTEPIAIDFDGIAGRAVPFPFPAGRYERLGCAAGSVAVLELPLRGWRVEWAEGSPDDAPCSVKTYDLLERKLDTALGAATDWCESADGSTWLYRIGTRYRALPAATKPKEMPPDADKNRVSRTTGWMDLTRITLAADPRAEYEQILHEAWALQRDHFYDSELVNVDWNACLARYAPLLQRVRTREELIDLLWEMQGELGTSHAYAMGGDMSKARRYSAGQLGCDFVADEDTGALCIAKIYTGDVWEEDRHSPLAAPGKNVGEGDYLLAVDGNPVGAGTHPGEFLLEKAKRTVSLTIADDAAGTNTREVSVTPSTTEQPLRYRDWVETNRQKVHTATDGQIGYVHIPDMGLPGAIEFHRHFLWQVTQRRGFVIDNRFNGGGNISGILIAKLLRQVVGWTASRWSHAPRTYPYHAPMGPVVVLTNENAGSDGDIFSQAVKATGLGPLIGMRTWGGVVGIDQAKSLVDGGFTTQPEYAFWFNDVGWSVENHGVEPDIVVDRSPADAWHGRDPQLDRAIREVMELLEAAPPAPPDLGPRPDLRHPRP